MPKLSTSLAKAAMGQQSSMSQMAGIGAPKLLSSYAAAKQGKQSSLASIAGLRASKTSAAFMRYSKRANVPTRIVGMGRVKGIIGEKRLKDLQRAVKNRNARMRHQTVRLTGEAYSYENYLKLVRGQYLPPVIRVDLSKVTSVKDYNALMRMIEADKTKEWKYDRLQAMRDWMRKSVKRSIWIDEDDDPELFAHIDTMSEKEILDFRRDYKGLISDIFEYYNETQGIDADDRDIMWTRIRQALGLTGRVGANPIIAL